MAREKSFRIPIQKGLFFSAPFDSAPETVAGAMKRLEVAFQPIDFLLDAGETILDASLRLLQEVGGFSFELIELVDQFSFLHR